MTILDKIIAEKQHEVSARKQEVSIHQLEKSSTFSRQTISLKSLTTVEYRYYCRI